MSDPGTEELPRLAWRCRRGMKELDLLLRGWLEARYPLASASQRLAFERLLELSDPQLAGCLLGAEPAPHADLAALIEAIRAREPGVG